LFIIKGAIISRYGLAPRLCFLNLLRSTIGKFLASNIFPYLLLTMMNLSKSEISQVLRGTPYSLREDVEPIDGDVCHCWAPHPFQPWTMQQVDITLSSIVAKKAKDDRTTPEEVELYASEI
jgi:hypothetical protein